MISRNFLKSSLIYALAGALPLASSIILLPLYNLYLSVDVFGTTAIYVTFSLLIQILVTYSFDLSLYVFYQKYKNDEAGYDILVGSSFLSIAFLGCVAIIFFVLAGDFIFQHVYANPAITFFPFGLMSIVAAIFQAFFRVYTGMLQIQQKPVPFFWSNLFSFSLVAIMTIIGLELFPNSLVGPIGGRMVAIVISGLWALISVGKRYGFKFNFDVLQSTFSFNNGQYIYQVQQWLINNFDKILIASYLTLTDVGVYDFAFKCLMVIDFVMSGFNNTILPKVLGVVAEQKVPGNTPEINRYYHGIIAVNMILVVAAITLSPYILGLNFIRPGYRNAIEYIPLLSIVFLIKGVRFFFSFPFGALRYSKPLPVIYLIVSAIKIGLMIAFIPKYGVFAVIISAIVSGIVELTLLWISMRRKFQFSFNKFKIILAPASMGALIAAMELMNWHGIVPSLVFFIICGGILWSLYHKELRLLKLKI